MLKKLRKEFLSVAMQSIDFSNEKGDQTNSSLEIYPHSPSWIPEHFSYAAYSISDAREAAENDKLLVWAKFFKDTPKGSVQIRAVNTTPKLPKGLSEKVFERYEGQSALGEIKSTRVFFSKTGQSVYRGKNSNVPFKISGSKFPELGVGIYDIIWTWQYRTISSKSTKEETVWNKTWIPFENSMHRIFITVDCPKAPWSPTPFSGFTLKHSASPIWTEALEIACIWAKGSRTIEEAGKKIADQLFNSGKFVYHPDSHYCKEVSAEVYSKGMVKTEGSDVTMNFFQMSKVIERIQGGNGLGEKVNCVDCSLIVSTLTNVLGGNLQVGKLQHTEDMNYADPDITVKNRFEINRIKAIGLETETTMSSLENEGRHYFSFHSIAWQPADVESPKFDDPENIIYDACVQIITDDVNEDEDAETASGIPLGKDKSKSSYRAVLAAPTKEGIEACIAQQPTVRRIQLV